MIGLVPPSVSGYTSLLPPPRKGSEEDEVGADDFLSTLPTVRERRLTDVKAFIVLSLTLSLALCIGFNALKHGDLRLLIRHPNQQGMLCPKDSPYIFFPLGPTPSSKLQGSICLAACPTEADAATKKQIPVVKTQTDRSKDGFSATFTAYAVSSSSYATHTLGNGVCAPIDGKIRKQFALTASNEVGDSLRGLMGSLVSGGLLLVVLGGMSPFVLGVCHTLYFTCAPRANYSYLSTLHTGGVVGYGVLLVVMAIRSTVSTKESALFVNGYLALPGSFFADLLISALAGTVLTLCGAVSANRLNSVGNLLYQMTASINASRLDRGRMAAAPVMSAINFVIALVSTYVGALLISNGSWRIDTVPILSKQSVSVFVTQPFRQSYFPLSTLALTLLWFALTFLFIGCSLELLQFSVAYAAIMWYFSANTAPTPSLVALSIGATYHLGSLAASAIAKGAMLLMKLGSVQVAQMCEASDVDMFPPAGTCVEMATNSTGLNQSAHRAYLRLYQQPSVTGGLVGAIKPVATSGVQGYASICAVLAFVAAAMLPVFSTATSPWYVLAPGFLSLVVFAIAAVVIWPFLQSVETLTDSLLYCYLIESAANTDSLDENPATKMCAPVALRHVVAKFWDALQP